jgi:4-hydroxybenzoate polyprenyltransferase
MNERERVFESLEKTSVSAYVVLSFFFAMLISYPLSNPPLSLLVSIVVSCLVYLYFRKIRIFRKKDF